MVKHIKKTKKKSRIGRQLCHLDFLFRILGNFGYHDAEDCSSHFPSLWKEMAFAAE